VDRPVPPLGITSIAPTIPSGTPSIAMPMEVQPWWARRISEALQVWEGSLALVGLDSPGLVVLPSCEGAQAVPQGIRAGGMVDRAGRAPYPQLR
jgi:hypothetical protein